MSDTFNDILNFIIPIGVYIFIGWIIYRIPLVKDGVDKLRDWNSNRKNKSTEQEALSIKSITYE